MCNHLTRNADFGYIFGAIPGAGLGAGPALPFSKDVGLALNASEKEYFSSLSTLLFETLSLYATELAGLAERFSEVVGLEMPPHININKVTSLAVQRVASSLTYCFFFVSSWFGVCERDGMPLTLSPHSSTACRRRPCFSINSRWPSPTGAECGRRYVEACLGVWAALTPPPQYIALAWGNKNLFPKEYTAYVEQSKAVEDPELLRMLNPELLKERSFASTLDPRKFVKSLRKMSAVVTNLATSVGGLADAK